MPVKEKRIKPLLSQAKIKNAQLSLIMLLANSKLALMTANLPSANNATSRNRKQALETKALLNNIPLRLKIK
jgi:hypothetical protein